MSILIRKGKAFVEGKFIETDLLIKGSVIKEIGKIKAPAEKVIDGKGRFIVPGFIDAHVHFRDFGEQHKENWVSGSRAAASSGITTVLDMPNNKEPVITGERLRMKSKAVSMSSIVNFGLFIEVRGDNIKQVNSSGARIAKLYYGHTTGSSGFSEPEPIFRELAPDILIAVHAEESSIIKENMKKADKDAPNYHSLIRDRRVEMEAVRKLLFLAEKYSRRVHFCHISTADALSLIIEARRKGINVTCETCAHYLLLNESLYTKIGGMAKVNPSLKAEKDNEMLWRYLIEGHVDILASDHAPHLKEEKMLPYDECPAGFPGVETTVPLMLTKVNEGIIDLGKLVNAFSCRPAEIFKLKNKGKLKKGYDADIAIIDMEQEHSIKADQMYSKAGWTPFEGWKCKGKAIMTIVNGNLVYDGEFNAGDKGREVIFGV